VHTLHAWVACELRTSSRFSGFSLGICNVSIKRTDGGMSTAADGNVLSRNAIKF